MKKFRLCILIVMILLVSGCDSSYNVTISDKRIVEEVNLNIENYYENLDSITSYDYGPLTNSIDTLYDKKITKDDNFTNMTLKYTYKPESYSNSVALSSCFENREVTIDDEYFDIKLSGYLNCLYDGEVDINVKTNNKVISNNADSVSGNVYTWRVNQENKDNVSIEIKIKKGGDFPDILVALIAIGIIIIGGLVTYRIFKKKNNERNEI